MPDRKHSTALDGFILTINLTGDCSDLIKHIVQSIYSNFNLSPKTEQRKQIG